MATSEWLNMFWLYTIGTLVREYLPLDILVAQIRKLWYYYFPYVYITFHEYRGKNMRRNPVYSTAESYLTAIAPKSANKLTGTVGKESNKLILSMGDNEEVKENYRGAKLRWSSIVYTPVTENSFYPNTERRSYRLRFHKRDRNLILNDYLTHFLKEGKEISLRNRQRKLYTNNPIKDPYDYCWTDIVFEHPASFDTLAMDATKKREIMDDLDTFRKGKEYYSRIGKAWKRGYLLYGPPGTGKSTLIAAMANYMDYDIYDIELTIVKTNTDLRKLFIETSGKSIIVLEDIDCSLDLTGKRKKKTVDEDSDDEQKVTLSGLLNFIDGLWSSSGGERLIVFTTNHVDKLDPALIRRGRMDKHIEMSYCGFEAFKVLAHNYLKIDSHPLFGTIERLIGETKISPADVAENLMPKSLNQDPETCLVNLINELKKPRGEETPVSIKVEDEESEDGIEISEDA